MTTTTKPSGKTDVIRVRVRPTTKETVRRAAEILDTSESGRVRMALAEYLRNHLPHAA